MLQRFVSARGEQELEAWLQWCVWDFLLGAGPGVSSTELPFVSGVKTHCSALSWLGSASSGLTFPHYVK